MAELDHYLDQHREAFEQDLFALLRIPSVSTDSRYRGEVAQAAQWLVDHFQALGLHTETIPTAGHPIVYAESPKIEGAPTALVYGHYDVQPPDPLDQWVSPPFEPTVRDGNVYARGATDDKGQMLTHVKSAQAWLETAGQLPIQLKFLIEGEEEVGSQGLSRLLRERSDRLGCDTLVISDMSQFGPEQPAITYGLRGIAYFELRMTGPKQDLHSGTFGGAVVNPANCLAQILSALVDRDGRIQLPGFYDDVAPLTQQEREQFAALPFQEERFFEQLGVAAGGGERGYTTLERRWARPTYDVHGLTGGYQGEGGKTIVPSRASAKFSFRLVPEQHPAKIAKALRQFINEHCPTAVQWELEEMHGAPGITVPLESPYIRAAAAAVERGFGQRPVFIREGGSIPIVGEFRAALHADPLLLGWGLNDDNTHSPNEKFNLADYHRGIRASAHLWGALQNAGGELPGGDW